eukprot:403341890
MMAQTQCNECLLQFNLNTRRPILLQECGCTYCLGCIASHLKDNPTREVQCPEHKTVSTMPLDLDQRLNKNIISRLQSFDNLTIICVDHAGHKATQYCTMCQIPTCPRCSTHSQHHKIDLKKEQFQTFSTYVQRLLYEYSAKHIRTQLDLQSNNRSEIDSSKFKMLLDRVKGALGNMVSKEERQKIDLAFYLNDSQQDQQQFHLNNTESNPYVSEEVKAQSNDLRHGAFQQLITESLSQMRNDLKYTIDAFKDKNDKAIGELKSCIYSDFTDKFKAFDELSQKVKSNDQLILKSDLQIQELNSSIEQIKINQDKNNSEIQNQLKQQRLKQTEDFLTMNEALQSKVKSSIQKKITSAKELIDSNVNCLESLINSTKQEQNIQIEMSKKELTDTLEQFKVQTTNNLEEKLEAFDNALKTTNQNLQNLEQNSQQLVDFKDDHANQLMLLHRQLVQSLNELSELKRDTNTQFNKHNEVFEDVKVQIDNLPALNDIKQLIKESQSQLRDELKNTFDAFETDQRQVNDSIRIGQANADVKIEKLQRDIQTNLSPRFDAIESTIETKNLRLTNLEQQVQNLSDDYSNQLELLKTQIIETNKEFTFFKHTLKQEIDKFDDKFVEFKEKIDNDQALLDNLQLKIQEVNNNLQGDSSHQISQESKFKFYVLSNLKILSEKLNEQLTKTLFGKGDDHLQLKPYLQIPAELVLAKHSFRQLVDLEIIKQGYSLLHTQIPNFSKMKFKLLYRGSRNGFKSSKFHELCDNKGPTVSFIESECGQVFGGFTSIPQTSPDKYQCYSDPSAFVFSLSKRSIHKQYQNQDRAVWHDKDSMCVFGWGDIGIRDNCDKNSDSISDLGFTYELPKGYKQKSDETNSYLAGQYNFKVLEIEVYSLE